MMIQSKSLVSLCLLCIALTAQAADVKQQGNTVTIRPDGGQAKVIRLEVINDNIIRVRATSKDELPVKPASLMIVPQKAPAKGSYTIEESTGYQGRCAAHGGAVSRSDLADDIRLA